MVQPPMNTPKRVVLLIADDWGPLGGCYGNAAPETPNIDALAADGVVFHRAYCTTPSCGPSRACILTGRHSYTHGQYGNPHGDSAFRVREDIRPLTRDLHDAGVFTGIIGKRHIQPMPLFGWDFAASGGDVISKDQTIHELSEFLALAGDQAFFLMMAPFLPHRTEFDGFDHPNYEGLPRREYSPDEVTVPDFLPDLPGVRSDLAKYYTAVTRFDSWVGSVLEHFRAKGIYENTLFLVMSDHGMPFVGAKASPFEGGHRCPLIAACPGQSVAKGSTDALVNWLDVGPTLLEWFGLSPAVDLPGRSFLDIIKTGAGERGETFLSHMFHGPQEYYPYRILCRKRWKYILRTDPDLPLPIPSDLIASESFQAVLTARPRHFGQRDPTEMLYGSLEALYDLENDPAESRNLADDPAFVDVLAEMRTALHAHRVKTGDPLLRKDLQKAWREIYPRAK